jgi:hypothetical protein
LGINTVYTSLVKHGVDHSGCVRLFQEAGIYVLVGMGTASNYQPSTDQAWDVKDFRRYTEIMENLAPYPNVLGFEILGTPITLPYVKAMTRDLRAHLRTNGFRQVLMSTGSYNYWSHNISAYLACGTRAESPDFVYYTFRDQTCVDFHQSRDIMTGINEHNESYPLPVIFDNGGCRVENQVNVDVVRLQYNQTFINVGPGSILARYFDSYGSDNIGEYSQRQSCL